MRLRRCHRSQILGTLFLIGLVSATAVGQQVIQRGALGRPAQVLDDTLQWTTPFPVVDDKDVEIYIPDVTSPEWLRRNYQPFIDKGQYVLSVFTFYKNTKACEANMIGWGYADATHVNACVAIGYRVRTVVVETATRTVTLISAAMIDQDGQIVPDSVQNQTMVRRWIDLDANTQKMLEKTTEIVVKQMKIYDDRLQRAR